MSGEAPRTLSAVRHQMQGPALACEGSSALYGRLLLGTGPDMDAILTVLSVYTAHSTSHQQMLTKPAEFNFILTWRRRGLTEPDILFEQCTHVDKGRG